MRDQGLQRLLPGHGRRVGAAAPFVIPRPRHAHPFTHLGDRVVGLLSVDEPVPTAHRYSWAKKAAAFPRNSAFIRSSRTSFSNSRSRARSETDSGGSSSACSARYLFTQLPSVPSFTPIWRATSATGRDASITNFTASSLNSGVKLLRRSVIPHPPFRTGPYKVRCPECWRRAMVVMLTELGFAGVRVAEVMGLSPEYVSTLRGRARR